MDKSNCANYMVGKKETLKGIKSNTVAKVFIAKDCDLYVVDEIIKLCEQNDLPIERNKSKKELGEQAGIKIGTAALGVIK